MNAAKIMNDQLSEWCRTIFRCRFSSIRSNWTIDLTIDAVPNQ
ncbi:hypothetical protein RE6C_01765 [Rhodopirellula europaea 6C]|uniref:Uncharacterized protein n=1 Tax=Rhodopirellula europaea 6C TaxID=1263867 RepID=M2B5N7_9BACT|nr:hypothetical protein RE6C_01765 [Rhodopirellula europaea 6C]